MATEIFGGGMTRWEGGRDAEGHRTYKLSIQTRGDLLDGPASHILTPGLPLPGSVWAYGNDYDPWAWCDGAVDLKPREQRGNTFYDHVYTYSTKPRGSRRGRPDDRGGRKKCADVTIQNPLAEPPKRSGGTARNQEETQYVRNGKRIRATSFEPITGPQATFDRARDQVTIEFNDVNLNYAKYKGLVDTVNKNTLWGLPPRCWKLGEWHWEWKLYGTCLFYVTHRFVFESNAKVLEALLFSTVMGTTDNFIAVTGDTVSLWDHYVPDMSSLALAGRWDDSAAAAGKGNRWVVKTAFTDGTVPDYTKPNHYVVIPAPPPSGGNVRRCLSLSTRGVPALTEDDEMIWCIRHYAETDFLAQIPFLPSSL